MVKNKCSYSFRTAEFNLRWIETPQLKEDQTYYMEHSFVSSCKYIQIKIWAITLTRRVVRQFWLHEGFGRTYHKDRFINWKFYSIYYSFQDIGWKLLKTYFFFFCLSRATSLTWSHLKIWALCKPYNKNHCSNWTFHSIYHSFQNIGWKLFKKVIFHLSRAITLTWSRMTTLIMRDYCRPNHKDHFSDWKRFAKPNHFGYISKKLLSDPYVKFLTDQKSKHSFCLRYPEKQKYQLPLNYV